MTEIYYWEDDDKAERIMAELNKRGIKYEAIMLDAEVPNAQPSVQCEGKSYWDLGDFLKYLKQLPDKDA